MIRDTLIAVAIGAGLALLAPGYAQAITRSISDDATGGACTLVGSWDAGSKTCTLASNSSDNFKIISNGITLDGAGFAITGVGSGRGVELTGRSNVAVKNLTISNFKTGIMVQGGGVNYLTNNTIANNIQRGIWMDSSGSNVLRGNVLSGNRWNLDITTGAYTESTIFYHLGSHDIDTSNTVQGLPIYFFRNLVSATFDGVPMGAFYCTSCDTVTLKNINFPTNNTVSVSLVDTDDSQVENISVTGGMMGVSLHYSRRDTVALSTFAGVETTAIKINRRGAHNILNNTLSGGSEGITVYRAPDGTIRGNKIENFTRFGITLGEFGTTVVEDNRITGSDTGLLVGIRSHGNTVRGNIMARGSIGLNLDSANNNIITGNLIAENTARGVFYEKNPFASGTCVGNQFYGNDVMDNALSIYKETGCDSSNLFSGNFWSDYVPPGAYLFTTGQDDSPSATRLTNLTIDGISCCSSIIFLPGHQATRLVSASDPGTLLWEPSANNIAPLFMGDTGQSVTPDIRTLGIIDEVHGFGNVYKSFISHMNSLVGDGTINNWRALEYDWRLDPADIVEVGVETRLGHYDMVAELETLAMASKTGKVTIVTHSNGGLVAKFLLDRLVREGKEGLVDRLIMVAAPQIGTPQALATLMHGEEINFPSNRYMNRANQRALGENMVSAYNLLPSGEYFRRVADPVVEFDSSIESLNNWRALYGATINSRAEMENFITGGDGRAEPPDGDTITPNVLEPALLARSSNNQAALESWMPPLGVEVTQIVGWGLDTLRGMRYVARTKKVCASSITTTCPYFVDQKILDREPLWLEVVDGDGTVLGVSAGYLNETKYFMNLPAHNREFGRLRVNRDHADILEPEEVRDLIGNLITVETFDLPPNISLTPPPVVGTRLRLRVLSPVSIEVIDSLDNVTNSATEEIPNSYYTEFGEGKYVGLDTDDIYTIHLQGTDTGVLTFIIEEVSNGNVVDSILYTDVPVTPQTSATMTIQNIESASDLQLDVNGDGQVDKVLDDDVVVTPIDRLNILSNIMNSLNISSPDKRSMTSKINDAIKLIQKGNIKGALGKLGDLQNQIRALSGKKIDQATAVNLLQIIETIKSSL